MKVINEVLSVSNDTVLDSSSASLAINLNRLGFSIGGDVVGSVKKLSENVGLQLGHESREEKEARWLEKEEKEIQHEEEVDRLILKNLCGDIMEEILAPSGDGPLTSAPINEEWGR